MIAEFKKMRELQATVAKLVAAAQAADFLAVDDAKENVRRTTPLPDTDVTIPRSIMAEKFPADATIEAISEFFSTFAPVLSVRLLKVDSKGALSHEGEFKGGVWIEFDSEESAKKVSAQEISYKDEKLTMQAKEQHLKAMKEIRAKDSTPGKAGKESKKRGRDSEGGERGEDKEGKDAKKSKKDTPKKEEPEKEYKAYPKGIFVNVKGIGEGCTVQLLKDIYTKYGNVKFVEFREGQVDLCPRARNLTKS